MTKEDVKKEVAKQERAEERRQDKLEEARVQKAEDKREAKAEAIKVKAEEEAKGAPAKKLAAEKEAKELIEFWESIAFKVKKQDYLRMEELLGEKIPRWDELVAISPDLQAMSRYDRQNY